MRLRLLVPVFAVVALVSCGGGGDKQGAKDLLDRAFSHNIKSADLKVDATLQLKGSDSLDKPVRIQATGPFRTNEGKLPSADLELKVGTGGGGQTIQTGFLSTGDRAFVKFEDVYYEQPASQVRAANRSIAKAGKHTGSLRSLGLDPRSWVTDGEDKGDERVSGVNTTHVSGKLDVGRLMSNINEFVKRSGAAINGVTGQQPPGPLSKKEIDKISEVVKDPQFDVYVGKEDDTIRRVAGRVEFDVPEDSRASLGGISGGSLEFSVEFANVNGDQQIEAPANARPISELTRSLGGTGVLGGVTGDGSSGGNGTTTTPLQPNGTGTAPTTTDQRPDAEDFKAYAKCLDDAKPEDTDALQRCAELLNRP